MNTKIALSGLSILATLALVGGATFAFFSDTETSTGNTLSAGEIDLKIDNVSYLNKVLNTGTTWREFDDLPGHLFFNFSDLKPGDFGEDTISLHVFDNDAWACVEFTTTKNDDVNCTDPEKIDDPDCLEPNGNDTDGDLASQLNFIFWTDDGDNVLETDEPTIASGSATQVLDSKITLADSGENNVGGNSGDPLEGSTDYFIGKAWCFGELTPAPVAPGLRDPTQTPGVTCDGTLVNNAAQTDQLVADVTFTAEQFRNNSGFLCNPPSP